MDPAWPGCNIHNFHLFSTDEKYSHIIPHLDVRGQPKKNVGTSDTSQQHTSLCKWEHKFWGCHHSVNQRLLWNFIIGAGRDLDY